MLINYCSSPPKMGRIVGVSVLTQNHLPVNNDTQDTHVQFSLYCITSHTNGIPANKSEKMAIRADHLSDQPSRSSAHSLSDSLQPPYPEYL